jgi:galactose-1-phosphate uridylyltransferase
MRLSKIRVSEKILDSRRNFQEHLTEIEYRKHPLLGFWCRINHERARRPKQVVSKKELSWVKATKEKCPFCEESVRFLTPKFNPKLVSEGRIRIEESYTFPNLYPFGTIHSVCVLTKAHFLLLNQFKPEYFSNAFFAVKELFKRAKKGNPKLKYVNIGMNYLQPAGSSLVHPHLQVQLEKNPSFYVKEERKKSRSFYSKNKQSFWNLYIKFEKSNKERYIGSTQGFEWIASYAPLGRNEVIGINTSGIVDFMQLDEKEIHGLSKGITKVLKGYHKMGISSFNFGIHSWPNLVSDYSLHIHIISRPKPIGLYCSDRGFLETLFGDVVADNYPENVALIMRNVW